MEKKEIVIFGAGGHASKMVEISKQNNYVVIGYISIEPQGTKINNIPVLGNINYFKSKKDIHEKKFHIAIGENSLRHDIYQSIQKYAKNLISLISKNSFVAEDAVIGNGSCINHGVIISRHTQIGKNCIVDSGAILEHDCEIGDLVNISPGAVICGGVKISSGAIIGAGSVLIEKVQIGENTLIGAGSVVTKDIGPNVIAVGNPVKIIRKRKFSDTYLK